MQVPNQTLCGGSGESYVGEHAGQCPTDLEFDLAQESQLADAVSRAIESPANWIEWLWDCKLDDWQRDAANAFARGEPIARCVANSGGKSRLIAGLGTWLLAAYEKVKVVMTAGVYRQCEIMRDMELRPVMHKLGGWIINDNRLVHPRGTQFMWFSADNPNYFEGHHADHMGVLIDEAKGVDPGIYAASDRCIANVRRYRMVVSSAGPALGWFYDCFSRHRDFWNAKQISAYEIKRYPKFELEDAEKRKDADPDLFKSKILAEFTESEEGAFIRLESVNRCLTNPTLVMGGIRRAGLDIAGGGDDNVIVVAEGNQIINIIVFKEKDTMRAAGTFVTELNKLGVDACNVHADNGGVGQSVLDRMDQLGFSVNRVNFGGSPLEKSETITNRMTELWAYMREQIDGCKICFSKSIDSKIIDRLKGELACRKVIPHPGGKLKLQEKKNMSASPDIADALALALQAPVSFKPFVIGDNSNDKWSAYKPSYDGEEGSGKYLNTNAGGISFGR